MGSIGCLLRSSLSLNYISGCFLAMETKAHIVSKVVFVAINDMQFGRCQNLTWPLRWWSEIGGVGRERVYRRRRAARLFGLTFSTFEPPFCGARLGCRSLYSFGPLR